MKKFILFFYLFFSTLIISTAQNNSGTNKEETYFDIEITVTGKGKKLKNASIEVNYENNIFPYVTENNGKAKISLPLNFQYTITITSDSYFQKVLFLDTHVPGSAKGKVYSFEFTVDLLEKITGFNASFFEKPIAKIKFSPSMGDFYLDERYHSEIAGEQKKQMELYDARHKAVKDSLKRGK